MLTSKFDLLFFPRGRKALSYEVVILGVPNVTNFSAFAHNSLRITIVSVLKNVYKINICDWNRSPSEIVNVFGSKKRRNGLI